MEDILYLTEGIELGKTPKFMKHFMKEITSDKKTPIQFFINSSGGAVADGLGMASMIMNSKREIQATVIGSCYSAATFLLLASHKKYCYKYSEFMFHGAQCWMGWEKAQGVLDHKERFEETEKMIKKFYKSRLNPETFKKVMKAYKSGREWYFYGDEALKLGIVDKIL